VKPLWHPLSTLVLPGLGCYASPNLIRMMLSGGGAVELLYSGDRMWPAVRSGQRVRIEPFSDGDAAPGALLVILSRGIPDLLRVARAGGDEMLCLRGDADPHELTKVRRDAVLAAVRLPVRAVGQAGRRARRLWLELTEAMRGVSDDCGGEDPAATVLHKYESQAPYYAASSGEEISAQLLERIAERVPRHSRLLVMGSGTGRECYALRQAGYRVSGVDFSPAMIECARRGARERNLDIDFTREDMRQHREPPRSLAGILFTYGVYSFLCRPAERMDLLQRMARWLVPGGPIFLSARLVHRPYERLLLTLQWMRAGCLKRSAWGDSHTRYLTPDGVFHRSFIHCFTLNRLRREVRAAGLAADVFHEGHFELSAPGRAG